MAPAGARACGNRARDGAGATGRQLERFAFPEDRAPRSTAGELGEIGRNPGEDGGGGAAVAGEAAPPRQGQLGRDVGQPALAGDQVSRQA